MAELKPRIIGTEMEYGISQPTDRVINWNAVEPVLPNGIVAIKEFLSNGSRLYVDMHHKLEYATPECMGAVEATHAEFAGETIVFEAVQKLIANERLYKFPLRKCVIDFEGKTWGYHENYEMSRNDYLTTTHHLYLMGHLASRSILVGAGHIISTNDGYTVLPTQKMHGISELTGNSSTTGKALVNTRDEPLTAHKAKYARQHIVCGDANITGYSTLLKLGSTSLVLRLAETQSGNARRVVPVEPLKAARNIGTDSEMTHKVAMEDGRSLYAIDISEELLEQCEDLTQWFELPEDEIAALGLWRSCIDTLRADKDEAALRIEWLAKAKFLDKCMQRKKLSSDDQTKLAIKISNAWDHLDLDLNIGLRWMMDQVDDILDEEFIERLIDNPPLKTRARVRSDFIVRNHKDAWLYDNTTIGWDYCKVGSDVLQMPHARLSNI